jgi:hypothetical protein
MVGEIRLPDKAFAIHTAEPAPSHRPHPCVVLPSTAPGDV